MVRHVIIWNIYADTSAEDKAAAKAALEALVGKIDGLLSLKVELAPMASSTGHMMLDSTFESADALAAYATNPAHVAAARLIRDIYTSRVSFDYEC